MSKKAVQPPEPAPAGDRLSPRQDALLKASKEIVVKFIESGRLSVTSFAETFRHVYETIEETVERDRR